MGGIVDGGCTTDLAPEVIAAYDAPFPDDSYKAGARLPAPRADEPRRLRGRRQPCRLGRPGSVGQAAAHRLLRQRPHHPRRGTPVREGAGRAGPGAHDDRRRRSLPPGGQGRRAGAPSSTSWRPRRGLTSPGDPGSSRSGQAEGDQPSVGRAHVHATVADGRRPGDRTTEVVRPQRGTRRGAAPGGVERAARPPSPATNTTPPATAGWRVFPVSPSTAGRLADHTGSHVAAPHPDAENTWSSSIRRILAPHEQQPLRQCRRTLGRGAPLRQTSAPVAALQCHEIAAADVPASSRRHRAPARCPARARPACVTHAMRDPHRAPDAGMV